MTAIISNEFAASIVAQMRAEIEKRDVLTGAAVDNRDLLLLKLYDDLQALTKAMAFLGGGIPPLAVRKVDG